MGIDLQGLTSAVLGFIWVMARLLGRCAPAGEDISICKELIDAFITKKKIQQLAG